MYKFVVLSVLVFGCTAVPLTANTGFSGSYGTGAGYGSGLTIGVAQPKVVVGGSYGGSYGSGLRSGYGVSAGYGSGYGAGLSTGYSGGLSSGFGAGYRGVAVNAVPAVATVSTVPVASGLTTGYSGIGSGYSGIVSGAHNNFGLLSVHQGQQFEQVVPAAIQQISRTVEYRPFANQEQPIQAQVVEIEPSDNPVHLHFKTRSSTLSVSQSHEAAQAGEVQTSAAQDEPQRLITEVQKPVIQEVREVISPFRQVTQEINPVVESLHTIVTKGEGYRQQYQGANIGAHYQSGYVAPATVGVSNIHTVARPVAAVQAVARPVAVQSYQAAPLTVSHQPIGAAASFGSSGHGLSSGFQSSSYSAPVSSSFNTFSSKPANVQSSSYVAPSSGSHSGFNSFSIKPANVQSSSYVAPSSGSHSGFNSFSIKPANVQSSSYVAPSSGSSSFSSFSSKPAHTSSSFVAPSSHSSTSYVAPSSGSSSFSSFSSKPAVSQVQSSFSSSSSSSDSSSADTY